MGILTCRTGIGLPVDEREKPRRKPRIARRKRTKKSCFRCDSYPFHRFDPWFFSARKQGRTTSHVSVTSVVPSLDPGAGSTMKKARTHDCVRASHQVATHDRPMACRVDQYMSSAPPAFLPWSWSSFGASAIRASLVSSRVATEAEFCRAVRVTFTGSMTPDFTRSS